MTLTTSRMSVDPVVAEASSPAWWREFRATLSLHSHFVLHGNVRDLFVAGDGSERLSSVLGLAWETLQARGFAGIVCWDGADGFSLHPPPASDDDVRLKQVKGLVKGFGRVPAAGLGSDVAGTLVEALRAVTTAGADVPRYAFAFPHASRLVRSTEHLDAAERQFFLACTKLATTVLAHPDRSALPYNPVLWLVENERDLPSWFSAGSERIRTIAVPPPGLADRRVVARILTRRLPAEDGGEARHRACEAFALESSGLTLRAMSDVVGLAREQRMPIDDLPAAVTTYRLGVVENPWRHPMLQERIRQGEAVLRTRVRGQDEAVTRAMDVLKRAAMGLSGAQTGRPGRKPRGVLFFAGPTGVGKTELARGIAEIVYGDEDALLRFDMSEYNTSHAADRFVGAPPGYVGHDAGGQLTNAVREQPFRVILFDEIDKAEESVLDKFLQLLDDGRLTDGQGRTTYFSESVLVFTSNHGGSLTQGEGPRDRRVSAVEDVLATKLRPELRNRIGENVCVFDPIDERTAAEILRLQVEKVFDSVLREHDVRVRLDPAAAEQLAGLCLTDTARGGRGIGNRLEQLLVNPLACELFDATAELAGTLTITSIDAEARPPRLRTRHD